VVHPVAIRSILSTGIDDDIISENLPCRLSYSYSFATRGAEFIMLLFSNNPLTSTKTRMTALLGRANTTLLRDHTNSNEERTARLLREFSLSAISFDELGEGDTRRLSGRTFGYERPLAECGKEHW